MTTSDPRARNSNSFMGEGFQIIGSDGLRFDKKTYPDFAKQVTSYEIEDLVTRRDGDVLTATYSVTYAGEFEGVAREVPRLGRLAVFKESDSGDWKIQALAALGTGTNDVAGVALGVLATWLAATASGDAERVRALAAPDFQLQQADGRGASLADYLAAGLKAGATATVEDLVATSFSNTMVLRYSLRVGEGSNRHPRLTVFQRIDGKWLVAGEAAFPAADQ